MHISENEHLLQRAADRDEMSQIFQAFLSDLSAQERTSSERRRLEVNAMTLLRQMRLLKSRRIGDYKVVMTIANSSGEFPVLESIKSDRERILATTQEEQGNKHGVIISEPNLDDLVVEVKGKAEIEFMIKSASSSILLQNIHISGAGENAFSLIDAKLPVHLETSSKSINVLFQPRSVGLYRCTLRYAFSSNEENHQFDIVRHIKVRSGDAKLEALLRPMTPYEAKRKSVFDNSHIKEFISAPQRSEHGTNALKKLPLFKIPSEIRDLIISNELRNILEKPAYSLDTYSDFWSQILWASEFQAREDIKLFDMEDVKLNKEGHFYSFTVPGLAEGRPSVLRGDLIHITWKDRLHQGRVNKIRLLDVLLELDRFSSYNSGLDRVDIRFTFSRTTFRTSHEGVRLAPDNMGAPLLLPSYEHVKESLAKRLGREIPEDVKFANRDLNWEQQAAVINVLRGACRPMPFILFGPPGTGKSTTLVEVVYQLARLSTKPRILVVAPSNDATDLLVEKLSSYFPPSEMRRLLAFSRSIDQHSSVVSSYAKERLSGEAMLSEAMSAQIVLCTVNLAARLATFGLPRGHFDILCVDEAGHATEPEVIGVAASLMDFKSPRNPGQLVLAGDPRQLGPVVTSDLCRQFGLDVSYMDRLSKSVVYGRGPDNCYPAPLVVKLLRNYRSHPSILKLPNEMFYDSELIHSGNLMKTHDMLRWEHLPNKKFPVIFHSVHGENLREGSSPSWFNPQEAQEAVNYVDMLCNQSRPPVAQDDIGIITPYARQAQKIRLALASRNISGIKVGSVETFQGQERRCIILSTVRSEKELISSDLRYNLGFVANEKRFNVAVTRAISLLVVIGDPNVLATDRKHWLPFLQYCKDNDSWIGEPWEDTGDQVLDVEGFSDADSTQVDDEGPSAKAAQEAVGFINREE
jgi:helicase MOV-10